MIQSEFFVSPTGNDKNPGTFEFPFASLQKARDTIRTININMKGDILVNLRAGVYKLSVPFLLTREDSGTNGFSIIYQSYRNEIPIISGGVEINGWKIHDIKKNIYRTKIANNLDTRQLYVNGIRAIRARSDDAVGWKEDSTGYVCPLNIQTWKNISAIEVVSRKDWKTRRGPITKVEGTQVVMAIPYWKNLQSRYQTPPSWIENAYELLDNEGEWYFDKTHRILCYKPRVGENIKDAKVIFPKLETLVQGSNVSNIQFKGITFSYTTWLLPNSTSGYPGNQAGVLNFGQIPGNIKFDHSFNLKFENNTFSHLGVSALELNIGCNKNIIYNNTFYDISGSAISIGNVINPKPTEQDLVSDNIISNNFIRKAALEYEGCLGIFVGYTEHTTISHNEIRNLPYTGISMGWGWNNKIIAGKDNEISYNLIDSVMMVLHDGGGIYTLSSQPGTQIHDNYISNCFNSNGALYLDEGSSNMNWYHNVVQNSQQWLLMWTPSILNDSITNNFSDNQIQITKGTNCIVQNNVFVKNNNWPAEALNIMKNAGRIIIPIKKITLSSY